MPENADAWDLWNLCSTQWRVGFSLVGLDYLAVYETAKIHEIEMTPQLHQKIRVLERFELERAKKEADGNG